MPTYAANKKAHFEYEILEKKEAGLSLLGMEVKSVRAGQVKLTGAFVTFHHTKALLTNAHIGRYRFSSPSLAYDPLRSRTLLLRKKEIDYLRGRTQEDGLTIVPLSIYTKGRQIKLEIAVCRGKKKFDKRASIKKRELGRELSRGIKRGGRE